MERIADKKECANQLALRLYFEDRQEFDQSVLINNPKDGKRQNLIEKFFRVLLFNNDLVPLLLDTAVSHNLIVPVPGQQISPHHVPRYELNFRPSEFYPARHIRETRFLYNAIINICLFVTYVFTTSIVMIIFFSIILWAGSDIYWSENLFFEEYGYVILETVISITSLIALGANLYMASKRFYQIKNLCDELRISMRISMNV